MNANLPNGLLPECIFLFIHGGPILALNILLVTYSINNGILDNDILTGKISNDNKILIENLTEINDNRISC